MRVVFHLAVPEEQRPKGRMGHEEIVRGALTRNIDRDVLARIDYRPTRLLVPPFMLERIGLTTPRVCRPFPFWFRTQA
jgi:hypothetical protein